MMMGHFQSEFIIEISAESTTNTKTRTRTDRDWGVEQTTDGLPSVHGNGKTRE